MALWFRVNINFYCTLKNDIALGASASCNIIFLSAIKIDIALNQVPYLYNIVVVSTWTVTWFETEYAIGLSSHIIMACLILSRQRSDHLSCTGAKGKGNTSKTRGKMVVRERWVWRPEQKTKGRSFQSKHIPSLLLSACIVFAEMCNVDLDRYRRWNTLGSISIIRNGLRRYFHSSKTTSISWTINVMHSIFL